MEKVWKSVMPQEYPMEFEFIDDRLNLMYVKDEQLGKAISSFSVIAFILVLLGILGQVFQICINKTKEIGIRKVNGAKLFDIFKIINYRFVVLVLTALLIASPIAYKLMQKWLENFAYKTTLVWWVFALAGLGTLTFVITIVTLQSWNTARRNPIETLRYE
jgi:putative ABC transport system permease protein